ncbi:MAG: aminotransferase class IV, partial [Cyanobacteria bacterium Co-bin8]|nr:aminotransferase class IV [Cyanobacteria bacterium Co-bin8]
FTTLRVYGQSLDHPLTAWRQHCDRIRTSLQAFQWPQPDESCLRQGAEALMPHYPILRITLFSDGQALITGRPVPDDLAERQQQGITAWVAPHDYSRTLPAHKTGNYLACWLAAQAAKAQGAAEAILVDRAGHWLETSSGSLWGWAEGRWWTPPLAAGILPGVMRSQLIRHLHILGRPALETPWPPAKAQQFECLAYTNCVVEISPIHTVLQGRTRLEYNPDQGVLQELRFMFDEALP